MRVCILGPITPIRSGIARHTTALARELSGRSDIDLSVISFSRQYPKNLFPGDFERDPEVNPPKEFHCVFCLDSLNPLSWRTVIQRIVCKKPDLVIIPAWTFFLAPCLGFISRAIRRQRVPVIMVVHNAEDHETARWKTLLSRFQLRQAFRFLTHNATIAADLERLVPGTPVTICPHPVYDDYPKPRGDLARRASLELLFFGIVRPYKGLDLALRALAAADLEDVRLSVVGEFWEGRAETEALVRELGLGSKVELVPRYVSDQDTAEYFARCDAVLAPYRSATGSGVIALAQWYCRPVIASDVPGLSEAVSDGRTGWLFPARDVAALARILKSSVSRAAANGMHTEIEVARDELSWARFADNIVDLKAWWHGDTQDNT